jgi:hypothetical protein
MADDVDRARLDVQSLPDTALVIYEAIATLEYTGRRASADNIATATSLARPSVDKELAEMTRRGLIRSRDEQAEEGPVYVPAQRGWSAAPDQAEGHRMF